MDERRERNTGRSGRESGSKRKIFRRTVFLMLVCGVGLFIPLIGQLWNIAIVHHEEYQAEAVEQQTRDVEVAAFRGSIYDSSGDVLAMSATVYNLILSPRDLEASVDESKYKDEEGNADLTAYQAALQAKKDLVLDGVLAVLDLDREALADRLERTYSQYEVLKTNIEKEQAEQLRAFITENKLSHFLYLTPTTKRYYPYGNFLATVIGFTVPRKCAGLLQQRGRRLRCRGHLQRCAGGHGGPGGHHPHRHRRGDVRQLLRVCGRRGRL